MIFLLENSVAFSNLTEFDPSHGIRQRMSRSGHPYDIAPIKRYYNPLQAGLVNHFSNDEDLDRAAAGMLTADIIRPGYTTTTATPSRLKLQFFLTTTLALFIQRMNDPVQCFGHFNKVPNYQHKYHN